MPIRFFSDLKKGKSTGIKCPCWVHILLLSHGILSLVIMRVNKIILMQVIIFFNFVVCIEPFTPEINETQNLLVIEGLITDEEGFHHIMRLSLGLFASNLCVWRLS